MILDALTPEDLLILDAESLQQRLENGSLTSLRLVEACLSQIEKHDRQGARLQAIISIVPREILLKRAQALDLERKGGRVRSRLHGIPILVKDGIATNPKFGLKTSVGSLALRDSEPTIWSSLVDQLDEMGAIILAKSNLDEFMGVKGFGAVNGWSALGGQTQSAYIAFDPKDTGMGHTKPGGSSTGSAVGVSAGYSPIALGTDSIGSLINPATRAALYTIKPTVGNTDMTGIWGVSSYLDSVGGLTKSVIDLATITTALVRPDVKKYLPGKGYEEYLSEDFRGLRIGVLDPQEWNLPPNFCEKIGSVTEQIASTIRNVISTIRKCGATVVYPVSLPPISALELDGKATQAIAILHELQSNVNHYLSSADIEGIESLGDIVEFNKENASQELPPAHPDQDCLIISLKDPPSKEKYDAAVAHFRSVGRDQGIDKVFDEHDLNLLAFSTDSLVFIMASAAGYPVASMPLGLLDYNGRPFALGLIAKAGREDLMFQFMSAYEATFSKRCIPMSLLKGDNTTL